MGYVGNPEALYARALAWGLHQRGHHVRMLEERRNPTLRRTLETVGSAASRLTYERFPGILIHAFERRSGAPLMEWLARELSLVDLAIAVDGVPVEVARWIANLDHRALRRVYVTYRPDELTLARVAEVELERYDGVFASGQPAAAIEWSAIRKAIAPQDQTSVPPEFLPDDTSEDLVSTDEVAQTLERFMLPDATP